MTDKGYVILGAGLAGLSAARHLQGQGQGQACHVYEKEPEVGGLCRSRKAKGFTFDIDGHLLHFRHKGSLGLVNGLLKEGLAGHQRSAWVYSHERFIGYPFQANLSALPDNVRKECLDGFIKARRGSRVKAGADLARWIKGTFGDGIAKHFMVPYNTKFWTVSPRMMTCAWTEGFVPQPTLRQVSGGPGRQEPLGYNAHFWYPRKGGIEALPRALKAGLDNIHTGFKVRTIDLKKQRVEFSNGVKQDYAHLVSTIPLPELSGMISGLPRGIKAAFGRLRWNSLFNLNLGLRQACPSKKHWAYFPQKDISFFRVGFYHNFSSDLVPAGKSSLYAEVSYSRQKPLDKAGIVARIEQDLEKVGLLSAGDAVLVRDINDIEYAYPVYDKGYAAARGEILKFLQAHRVLTCGRYGSWRYMSMEDAILDGIKTGERLAHG